MPEQVVIDDKYTYEYDNGQVRLLRYGQRWVDDPDAPKAWIAAAHQIEELRAELAQARADVARIQANALDSEHTKTWLDEYMG